MQRAVVVSVLLAAAAGLAALSRRPPRAPFLSVPSAVFRSGNTRASLCPPGTLPDQGVCIPVPRRRDIAPLQALDGVIPRRPDRPADYGRYVLPVGAGSPKVVPAGGDSGTVRLAVTVFAPPATPVLVPVLEGQEGPARMVFTGKLLFERSIVTRHTVRVGDRKSEYLVLLGDLGSTNPVVKAELEAGWELGKTGESPIFLECRLLRPGVDPSAVLPERLLDDSSGAEVDPRNILSLRN